MASVSPEVAGKGKAFFDRADQVAATNNWDFAIRMYLDGIRREPANFERGHKPLREVALKRKKAGAKGGGAGFSLKSLFGGAAKDPVEAMLDAESRLAFDPGNVTHMVALLKAAQKLDAPDVVRWISEIILEVERLAKKPNRQICIMIATALEQVDAYVPAVGAVDLALKANPDDGVLSDMSRNLSAKATLQRGQYDGTGDFTKSVADLDRQKGLSQKDHLAQSRDFLEQEVARTQKEYEATPTVPGKIDAFVDALLKFEEEAYENQAVDVLRSAHKQANAYRYKLRMDDVRIRQMRRMMNRLREQGTLEQAQQQEQALRDFELAAYRERVENYPTDLGVKYELGLRLYQTGQFDEAIEMLQTAERDPKRRLAALNLLGLAFGQKQLYQIAVDTFKKALSSDPREEQAKELHYNLGVAYKKLGQNDKALDHFSHVAQMDYSFKDVRQQMESLRG